MHEFTESSWDSTMTGKTDWKGNKFKACLLKSTNQIGQGAMVIGIQRHARHGAV